MSPKQPDEVDAPGQDAAVSVVAPREEDIRAIYAHGLQFAGLLSTEGVLLETNPASLAFIGAERPEVIGRPF